MKKERVDILVVKQGLFTSREQAKRAIMAGQIYDEKDQRFDKAGEKVPETTKFQIKHRGKQYASRGGFKLEKALKEFKIDVKDLLVLDIGASTGGFTDVMLQQGAKLSYALDVGYNQLAWEIRNDSRVIVMERMNFRYATPEDFDRGTPEFASIDVSFISLKLILPVLAQIIVPGGEVVALVKPQFEAGKELVGKKGIVKEVSTHIAVLEEITQFALELGYSLENISFSPITGGEGNIEFLLHLKYDQKALDNNVIARIPEVVSKAHETLK